GPGVYEQGADRLVRRLARRTRIDSPPISRRGLAAARTRMVPADRGQDDDGRTGRCCICQHAGTAGRGARGALLSTRGRSAEVLVPQAAAGVGRRLPSEASTRSVAMYLRRLRAAGPRLRETTRVSVSRG